MTLHFQSQLADAANAGDGFAHGNLDGDVHLPKQPVCDLLVMDRAVHSEPRLTPSHDVVEYHFASFLTSDGRFSYVTQDDIATLSRIGRTTVCSVLKDLEAVGRYESKDVKTHEGKRAKAYRPTGHETGYRPVKLGIEGRVSVAEFRQRKHIHDLEETVRLLAARLDDYTDLPDNVVATIISLSDCPSEEVNENYSKAEMVAAPISLSSRNVDNALAERAAATPPVPATLSQMNLILMHQERTGLEEDDVLASWPDIDRYSDVPRGLDPSLMTTLQANRAILWLKRQPDAPVEVPEGVEQPDSYTVECTCPDPSEPVEERDEAAVAAWASTLGQLALDLPRTTFDNWLRGTEGQAFDGIDLLVQVPSVFTVSWLEQRMYQTILRALRQTSGDLLEVRFVVGGQPCRLHPEVSG